MHEIKARTHRTLLYFRQQYQGTTIAQDPDLQGVVDHFTSMVQFLDPWIGQLQPDVIV